MDDLQFLVSIDIPKSVGNINGDLKKLESLVNKLQVEVELKGLDNLSKHIQSFSRLESSVKEVAQTLSKAGSEAKQLSNALGKNVKVEGFDNISKQLGKISKESKDVVTDYTKLGQAIKSEMKEIGLVQDSITFQEFRNGAGDLEGLTAKFKATTGEVKEFVSTVNGAGKLELINVKSTASLDTVKSKIQQVRDEIEKFRSVIGNTKADNLLGNLNTGNIEGIQKQLTTLVKVKEEAMGITQALKKASDAFQSGAISGKQYDELANSLRSGKMAVIDFNQALLSAKSNQNTNNSAVKEEISLNKQRVQALNQLRTALNSIGNNVPNNAGFTKSFEEGKRLARDLADNTGKTSTQVKQLLSEYQSLIPVLRNISTASKKEAFLGDIDKSIAQIDKVKAKLEALGADQKFDDSFVESFKTIDTASGKTAKQLQQDFNQIQKVASEASKELAQVMKMDKFGSVVGDFDKFNALFRSGNTEGLRQYISELAGMEAQTMKLKTVMNGAGEPIQQLAVGFRSSGQEMKQITYTMDEITGKTGKLRQGMEELTFNANRNLSVWEQFKVAMSRFGVWSIAQEGIQAVTRSLKAMVTEILETDKQLTDIKRVISDGIDIDVLSTGAMNMATNLGNAFHDVLDAVGEIARAYGEFNEQQILSVANTATLMSNVSDISASDAIASLISTMKAFNIEAQDSMRIVDSWNEVDNNFAVSTEQIARAFEKSGATAKTFGVTMEENLGNITAIGETTMETGQVIGNSLKTLYSRITTLEPAKQVLESVGVAISEIGENGIKTNRDVQDILGDLAGKWNQLTGTQQQNIAVQVAGRHQLSRFLALMNNWQTSVDATNTAMNAQGGAMRENQAYLDSYEAKINKMKNVFSELALTVGNVFLKGGLNLGIDALTGVLKVLDFLVEKLGALGASALLLSPVIIKVSGLGKVIAGLSANTKVFESLGRGFTSLAHPIETAKSAIEKFKSAYQKIGDTKRLTDINKQLAGFKFEVKSTQQFDALKTNLTNLQATTAKLKNSTVQFSDSLQVGSNKVKVFNASAKSMGDNLKLVRTSTTNVGKSLETTVANAKGINGVSDSLKGVGTASQIASAGMRTLATAFKTVVASTVIGLAFTGVTILIEKFIGKMAEAKQKAEEQKQAQQAMVDAYRSSGDSLNDLIGRYDALNAKYGDFYKAVENGTLTPELNPQAYEEYEAVITSLSNKMPQLIEYTDANGQAHLKSSQAMKEAVKQAKELSQAQAKIELDNMATKLQTNFDDIDKAMDTYAKAVEKYKKESDKLEEVQKKASQISTNGYSTTGKSSDDLAKEQEQQASIAKSKMKEALKAQAEEMSNVREATAGAVATLKEYGSVLIEASGLSDKLGANSKALVENFAQNNASLIQSIELPKLTEGMNMDDFNTAMDNYKSKVQDTANNIKSATESMTNSIASAMSDYVDKNVTAQLSVTKIQEQTEKAQSEFESFIKLIPQSMQSYESVANGSFDKLMANSGKLIELQKSFTNGTSSYSDVRVALERMGVSTSDASKFMNNLAKEAGNVQVQAGLMGDEVEGAAESLNSLKDSTNEVVDSITELSGISSENQSALSSYLTGLKDAQDIYGENVTKSDLYKESIAGLTQMFGVGEQAIMDNLGSYEQLDSILSQVSANMTDSEGNTRTFAEAISMSGDQAQQAFERMQASGRSFSDELLVVLGMAPSFEEMASSLSKIDFTNADDQMANLVTTYMQGKTSFEEFSNSMKQLDSSFDETGAVYDTLQNKFKQVAETLLETAGSTGDVSQAFSEMRGDIEAELSAMGLPDNVVQMMMSQFETLADSGVGGVKEAVEQLNATTGDGIAIKATVEGEDVVGKLGEIGVKADEIGGKKPSVQVDLILSSNWQNNTAEIQKVIDTVQEENGKSITIEGKSYGLDELNQMLTNTQEGIDNAVSKADQVNTISQTIMDAKGNITQLSSEIDNTMSTIGSQLSDIANQATRVTEIKDSLAGLLDPIGQLHSGLSDASTGINGALDSILNKGQTVGSQLGTFKNAVDTLNTDTAPAVTNLNGLKDAMQGVSDNAGTLSSSMSGLNFSGIDASVASAVQSLQQLSVSAMQLRVTTSGIGAQVSADFAGIGVIAGASATVASSAFTTLASTVASVASAIVSYCNQLISAFLVMSAGALVGTGIMASAMESASSRVAGASSTIVSSLSGIQTALSNVSASANATRDALGLIGSAVQGALGSLSTFQARASSIIATANSVRDAVNSANSAKNNLVSAEKTIVITEAMKEGVRQGQPNQYVDIAINSGAFKALSDDMSSATSGAMEGLSGSFSASELDKPYEINVWGTGNGRKYAGINKLLSQMEAKLKGINRESSLYRGTLDVILAQQKSRLALIKQELANNETRKKQIEAELKKLPALGQQSEDQRKKYNDLQSEYDKVLGNMESLATESENLSNEIKDNIQEQFESFVDEIVKKYESAISELQSKVDGYDFELEVLGYLDSDNIEKKLELLYKKQQTQISQQSHYQNMQTELQKQYNDAVKKYGENDERSLYLKEQLTNATQEYRDATLEVLETESEIAEIREDVADQSIDKLKEYYENMKKMALDAIKAEQDALKKAQEAKNKLYDAEIQKIKDVYSAKLNEMDKEKEQQEYDSKMSDLYSERDELQRQIALAERDNSLAGKKRLEELKKQLAEQNKTIAEAEKERQDEILKEKLEAEQQAQIDAIEAQKEAEEKALQDKLDALDQQASDTELEYDNILDDDEYWANMKDKIMNGDLNDITNAMQDMYGNLANMGDGAFDGLVDGFANFSKEAQDSIKDLYSTMVNNMQFGNGMNILDILNQLGNGTGNYTPSNGQQNNQGSLGTPAWMTGNTGYSPDNILQSSGTAPAPPPNSGGGGAQGKPVIGGTYIVKRDVGAYYTSFDAQAHRSRRGTVKAGTYWIYNIYVGMINVTNKKGYMGSWINPADNKGGVDVNGNVVASEMVNGRIVEDGNGENSPRKPRSEFPTNDVAPRTTLSSLGASQLSQELQAFDTGGYTGNWSGNGGKLAMLHKKELVLNKNQTEDILSSAKIMQKLNLLTPSLLSPSLDGLGKANAKVVKEGDINVTVEVDKFTGTKQERDNLIGTLNQSISDAQKRRGRR